MNGIQCYPAWRREPFSPETVRNWKNDIVKDRTSSHFVTEGPQAMLKGAVIYGGIVYLLYGGAMGKKQPFQYKEQPIEF